MPHRFFAPDLTPTSSEVVLPPGESAHLARVLRLRDGEAIEIFDGRGALRQGIVRHVAVGGTRVEVGDALVPVPEPVAPIVVVQGLLKGDAMDAVVRDATVLGASSIQPVTTSRTNVPTRAAQAAHDRWVRVAIAAAKQCGRAVLPQIAAIADVRDVIDAASTAAPARLWLTEPAAIRSDSDVVLDPQPTCLAIGPEGGWSADEIRAAADTGWRPWTLAPVTLRAEHVTLAALSVLRYAWDVAGRRRIT